MAVPRLRTEPNGTWGQFVETHPEDWLSGEKITRHDLPEGRYVVPGRVLEDRRLEPNYTLPSCGTMIPWAPVSKVPGEPSELRSLVASWQVMITLITR
jgi:hypothetical protein